MAGHGDYPPHLYFEDFSTPRPPEPRLNRDSSNEAFSQFPGHHQPQRYPDAVRNTIGLGAPPIANRSPSLTTAGTSIAPGYAVNTRAASMHDRVPSGLTTPPDLVPRFAPPPDAAHFTRHDGYMHMRTPSVQTPQYVPVPGDTPPIDITTMLATMSLQQTALMQENAALKARIVAVEKVQSHPLPIADSNARVVDPRYVAASQKKRQRRARVAPTASLGHSASASSAAAPGAQYLGDAHLPPEFAPMRTAVQKFVTKTMRDVCDVGVKDQWPDPDIPRLNSTTGEIYLTPRFDRPLSDADNQHLIAAVSRRVLGDLQDENLRPTALVASKVTWDKALIDSM
ncbi:hypothetical protein B0H15DRAFT_802321 [Mycena belliarum]|uniref:Uncharacterized protein n=1 Tax=Mycena belliarum TaxID=1033014 RepID=A0AAD6XKD7_9AGAR|nr:hypothetical protein B0H15DRAFT_802318 [Mycena belliae]KAJ7084552.1 hypothetical protein B0H15DRAFT_802321 [Mycena belliae]